MWLPPASGALVGVVGGQSVLMVQNPTRLSWPPSPSAGSQPFTIASASSSPSHGGQSAASGVLGPGTHPSALHGLWASSLMMCSRQAALGLGSRGPCFFACQFLARGGNEYSGNPGVGWWHQPPDIQGLTHVTPYRHFPAWAGRPALDGKTHTPG